MRSLPMLTLNLLFSLLVAGVAQAQDLRLGDYEGRPLSEVVVRLSDDGATVHLPLTLSNPSETPIYGAILDAKVFDQDGQMVTNGRVGFVDPLAGDSPLAMVDLQAGLTARPVSLSVSGFSGAGDLTGAVSLLVDGRREKLAPLRVVRSGQASLRVLEADTDNALSLVTFGERLQQSVLVLEESGRALGETVTVQVSDLRTATGVATTLQPSPASWSAKPRSPQPLELSGTLPEPGLYRGSLLLTWGEGARREQVAYALSVRRETATDAFELELQDPAPKSPKSPARMHFSLREVGNRSIQLYTPRLASLQRKGTPTLGSGASYSSTDLVDWSQPPESGLVKLGPGQAVDGVMLINDLKEPGQYEARLEVTTPDGGRQTGTVTLYVRRGMGYCLLFIFLGAVLSTMQRGWTGTWRESATRLEELRRLQERLRTTFPANDPIALAMVDALDESAHGAWSNKDQVPAALVRGRAWIRNYHLVRSVLDLQEDLDELVRDDQREAELIRRVVTLRRRLTSDPLQALADDESGNNPLRAEALALRADIAEAVRTGLLAWLDSLATEQAALVKRLGAPPLSGMAPSSRKALLDDAAQLGEQALALRAEVPADGDDSLVPLRLAAETGERLELRWSQILLRELQVMLESEGSAPAPGFTPEGWQELRRRTLRLLEGAPHEAYRAWWEARIVALKSHDNIDDAYLDDIESARLAVLAGRYGAAIDAYRGLLGELEQPGRRGLIPAPAPAPAPEEQPGGPPLPPDLQPQSGAPPRGGEIRPGRLSALAARATSYAVAQLDSVQRSKDLRRLITFGDVVVFLVALSVSLFFGVNLLWSESPTWGSYVDMFNAFLWGFGLHELSQSTPSAARALQDRFAGGGGGAAAASAPVVSDAGGAGVGVGVPPPTDTVAGQPPAGNGAITL